MADVLATFATKPIYCGDTAIIPIQCRRADGFTPIDLSAAQLKATLKADNAAAALASFAIGTGITVTGAAAGNASLALLQAHTDQPAGTYTLDVLCIEADGTRTSVKGALILVDHPTR
jgi:hypothetical protein